MPEEYQELTMTDVYAILKEHKFIVNLKGKEFVTFPGLLHIAYRKGLQSLICTLVQIPTKENGNLCICSSTATFKHKITGAITTFTEIGDATPENVTQAIKAHFVRMCATRANARALRIGTDIGITALEELDLQIAIEEAVASKTEEAPVRASVAAKVAPKAPAVDPSTLDNQTRLDSCLEYLSKIGITVSEPPRIDDPNFNDKIEALKTYYTTKKKKVQTGVELTYEEKNI